MECPECGRVAPPRTRRCRCGYEFDSPWDEEPPVVRPRRRDKPLLGALVGAAAGAVLRFLVAVGFLYYAHHWGGEFWGKREPGSEMAQLEYSFALISAGIGLVIGAAAGATCRPIIAAIVGAVLSGLSCFGLAVLPTTLALKMSGPNTLDRVESVELMVGLLAMTLAGAVAGGIGALAGRARG